jgi:hypothetical protein
MYVLRQSPQGLFSGGLDCVEELVVKLGCRGHVLRGCSRRSFPCGGTPTHSFVNPSAVGGSRSGPHGPDTEDALRPSRGTPVVQSTKRSAARAESIDQRGLTRAREGLSSLTGRADATVLLSLVSSVVLAYKFPARLFLPTIIVLGEAEPGSAGTQPGKE